MKWHFRDIEKEMGELRRKARMARQNADALECERDDAYAELEWIWDHRGVPEAWQNRLATFLDKESS